MKIGLFILLGPLSIGSNGHAASAKIERLMRARYAKQMERLAVLMPAQRETLHHVDAAEFVRITGVAQSNSSAVLNGTRYFTYAYAEAIAGRFNASPAWILAIDLIAKHIPTEQKLLAAIENEHPITRHALITGYRLFRGQKPEVSIPSGSAEIGRDEQTAPESVCDLALTDVTTDDLLRLQARITEVLIERHRVSLVPKDDPEPARVPYTPQKRRRWTAR